MPPAAAAVRARSSVKHAGLALSSTRRATAVRATSDDATSTSEDEAKRRYVNFTGFPFPLVPFLSRRTVVNEVVKGVVWTLEQEQGIGFDLGVSTAAFLVGKPPGITDTGHYQAVPNRIEPVFVSCQPCNRSNGAWYKKEAIRITPIRLMTEMLGKLHGKADAG